MALRFGANASLNYNNASTYTAGGSTGTYASPVYAPISVVTDSLTADFGFDEADASHRQDNSAKAAEPTLQNNSIQFKVLEDVLNNGFLAIRQSALARTIMDILISTGVGVTVGEHTVRADMKVFEFKKSEPLNGINTWDVTMKRCYSSNPIVFTIN